MIPGEKPPAFHHGKEDVVWYVGAGPDEVEGDSGALVAWDVRAIRDVQAATEAKVWGSDASAVAEDQRPDTGMPVASSHILTV